MRREGEVPCPRCHEQCGWCSDYRHMHGKLALPGSRKRCTLPLAPEDDDCPVCHGSKRVCAVTEYRALPPIEAFGGDGNRLHAKHESGLTGPKAIVYPDCGGMK